MVRKALSSSRQGCIKLRQLTPRVTWLFHNVQQIFIIATLSNKQNRSYTGPQDFMVGCFFDVFFFYFSMQHFSKWTLKGIGEGQLIEPQSSEPGHPPLHPLCLPLKVNFRHTLLARITLNAVQSPCIRPQSFTAWKRSYRKSHIQLTLNYHFFFLSGVLRHTLWDCKVLSIDRRLRHHTKKWPLYIKS